MQRTFVADALTHSGYNPKILPKTCLECFYRVYKFSYNAEKAKDGDPVLRCLVSLGKQ